MQQIHTVRPLNPRAYTQVPPGVYQHFEDIRSTEQTSDEAQSAESFQEARLGDFTVLGFQQKQRQGPRAGATTHLTQGSGRPDRGWYPA